LKKQHNRINDIKKEADVYTSASFFINITHVQSCLWHSFRQINLIKETYEEQNGKYERGPLEVDKDHPIDTTHQSFRKQSVSYKNESGGIQAGSGKKANQKKPDRRK
jgi:hypothetical protein